MFNFRHVVINIKLITMPYRRRYYSSYGRRRAYVRRKAYGSGAYRSKPVRRRRSVRRAPVKRRRTVTRRSSTLRSISGMGAYRTKSNSLISKWVDNGPPLVKNARREGGGFIVSNREYLGNISSGYAASGVTPFNIRKYELNPGDGETFPWLSQIAQNFDQYRFRGLIFEYKSCSGDSYNADTLNLGTVILATDYNVLHPDYSSQREMENSMYASSAKPSRDVLHPIECAATETPVDKLYVRTANTNIAGGDLRLYDLANFYIATVGLPASAANIGELWVSYEVELFKPTLPPDNAVTAEGAAYVFYYNNAVLAPGWTSFTSTANSYFGTSASNGTPSGTGSVFPGETSRDIDNYLVKTSVTSYPRVTWGGSYLEYPYIYMEADDSATAGVKTLIGCLTGTSQRYRIIITWLNASTAATAVPTFTLTNCNLFTTSLVGVAGYQSSITTPAAGQTASILTYQMEIYTDVQNPSADDYYWSVTLSGGTLPGGATPAFDLFCWLQS